jgi:selenocysteine lyase/cysteine desulfurase
MFVSDLTKYIGNAEEFPILREWDFFNHAGVSPMPRVAADAMRQYARQAETSVYLGTNWYSDIEQLRILSAKVINAHRDEIAFVKNTSEGISIVAAGLDWQWGDVIVTTAVEYPANVYPWMEVARARGAKLVMVPEESNDLGQRVVPMENILKAAPISGASSWRYHTSSSPAASGTTSPGSASSAARTVRSCASMRFRRWA